MTLEQCDFPDLILLDGERCELTLGQHEGLREGPQKDTELVLLTNQRVFYLATSKLGRRIQIARLEDICVVDASSGGRNLNTLIIGITGVLVGVLGWNFLNDSFELAQWISGTMAVIGCLLLIMFAGMPERGAVALKTGTSEIRMQFRTKKASNQATILINRFSLLRGELWDMIDTMEATNEFKPVPGDLHCSIAKDVQTNGEDASHHQSNAETAAQDETN